MNIRNIKIETKRTKKDLDKAPLPANIQKMDEENRKNVFLLLLKNLKQAMHILEFFEDDKKFNNYFKRLLFEFDDTIKKAEDLNKYRNVETWIQNEYFKALSKLK